VDTIAIKYFYMDFNLHPLLQHHKSIH